MDSRLRGNDEPRRDGRRVSDPLAIGEWKLMLRKIETKTLDYARRLSRAPRAIRCANVRSGILPPQSRLRGNDELGGLPCARGQGDARARAQPVVKLRDKIAEPARGDRLAQPAHQILVIVQIMNRREHRSEHLAAAVEMAQVGAREAVAAGVARTGIVER